MRINVIIFLLLVVGSSWLYADQTKMCDGPASCTLALYDAIQANDGARVQFAIRHGANVNSIIAGKSMIEHATFMNLPSLVELLLNAGVDWRTSWEWRDPLTIALAYGYADIIRLLNPLLRELDYEVTDDGDYPLHYAAWSGQADVVRVLVEDFGVPIKATNNNGKTAEMLARDAGHDDIAAYLADAQGARSMSRAWKTVALLVAGGAMWFGYQQLQNNEHFHIL